ncbi:MAG: hypothetical protein ACTHU0_21510 [Kofleriaceae bacterium]
MIQFFAPTHDNNGVRFSAEYSTAFERLLLDTFGGFSREAGAVHGAWRNASGTVFHDVSDLYTIALESVADAALIRDVVDFACTLFVQETIFVRVGAHAEVMKPRTRVYDISIEECPDTLRTGEVPAGVGAA